MGQQRNFDVVIIGGGAAGLSLALHLPSEASIAIITKSDIQESSTRYAQGGISAVFDSEDSFTSHIKDTDIAGAGLCERGAVTTIVENAPEQIRWLLELGMHFTTDSNSSSGLHLTREGGHSHRRVIHANDATGKALSNTLAAKASRQPNIQVFDQHLAIDLITGAKLHNHPAQANKVYGVYVLDKTCQQVDVFAAKHIVLATGGASKVYLYTSNPDVSTGDGIAMAWRAGCRVANMEFIQFHPTCLYHPHAKSFLISEAVRGEGAHLLLPDGSRFMPAIHPRAELAPRDIVARAIDGEMKRLGIDCVYLDISFKDCDFIKQHFPNIYERCLQFGFDLCREPIPIVPAAHYTCGGVMTDVSGATDLAGLSAIGETAHTGLHGANRMASNSLLECLVMGQQCAQRISGELKDNHAEFFTLPGWDESQVTTSNEEVTVSHSWDELRRLMWDYVGIVRTDKRLFRALSRLKLLNSEIAEYYAHYRISNDLIELRNLADVATLIVRSALARKESRGLHYTLDYPETFHKAHDTILTPPNHPDLLPSPKRDARTTV